MSKCAVGVLWDELSSSVVVCVVSYSNGFAIFWDFLCGVDPGSSRCRISVTMFKGNSALSDTRILPVVSCEPSNGSMVPASRYSGRIAILGIKQVFPRFVSLQVCLIIALFRLFHS